ncbi:PREDICTED: IgGFc-binding protein-like [Branchiostoma belcheri]|uniref:IgGFc-binding protein-like n=1 Tax=Branchiostoma belcheri TaxID=7741 RepID=A0A6P4ZL17_BRABE|nr:PREDICTED: IgGFc-binding protein-like [Branchiostoma belcheri]
MRWTVLVLALLLSVSIGGTNGQGVRDNRGTEFLLTFLENFQRQGHQPALFISTRSPTATVTITLPSTGQTTTVTATNGQVTEVDLNRVAVELRGSRKSDKAIHVTSDEEIVIYGVFAEWATSDAYLALPTDVLGTEYFVACMTVRRAWSEEGWYNLPTEIGIVGVYDGTTITINPTQDLTFGGTNYPAGQDFTVSLDRFQTLQVQSTEDLTGSRITSSHPVSVLSGNLFTVIGNNQQGSGDHIVEMMPPVDTWGKEFVTAPIAKRTAGDIFRVVAARDNTEVTVTGRNPRNLDAGQFWEFEAGSSEYLHVTSNEPVLLVQYSKTAAADNTDTDPFSMIIPPVAQFEADYTFSTVELLYNGGAGTTHHVNLVIQSADKSGIIFDGQPLPGSTVWHPVPGTTYEATDLTISAGTHTATHSSPIATFGLFSYGLTNLEAYGYPGGLRLAQIGGACTPTQTVANDRVDNDCDGRVDEELRNGIDDDGDGLIDEDIASGESTEDLTGSRITSSHPVSVLSGNLFTVIGNNQQGSGDHIVEMMPPVDTWGKEFVTAPIAKRTAGDIFRVVAARDNTEVTVTGRNPRNLDAGQFWEFEAGSNEYLHVTSNEPVLLVQYSKTAAADNTDTDPFSMIIPPVAQFEADYTFSTVELLYNGGAGTTHHVNLVIQSADKAGIIFDGQPLPGSTVWNPVPGTTYEATDLTISAGTHTATHSSPIATFGLFSYGLTNLEAYGYPGGLRLAQIGGACTPTQTVANDRVDNDCDGRVDEELRNGIDDDGDGLIDEDIASGGTDVGRRPIFKISTIYPSLPQG